MTDTRHFHLRTAGTAPRVAKLHGRDHLVVPVVALMEGVIHAVNAATPEFVSADALARAAKTWNGRPLLVRHATNERGEQISGNDPAIYEKQQFGTIFSSTMNGSKLQMEAWIDPARLEALNEHAMLADIRAGKHLEVSVGAGVRTKNASGEYKGKRYLAEWVDIFGDHLAFLPGGRGACSGDMGCGANRAASHVIEDDIREVVDMDELKNLVAAFRGLAGRRNSAEDLAMIQQVHDHSMALGATCSPSGLKFLSEERKAEALKALKMGYEDCPECEGTGQITKDDTQRDCPSCGGAGEVKIKAAEQRAACSCQHNHKESTVDKTKIASFLKLTDVKALDSFSEDTLKALESQVAEAEKLKADLKAAQDALTATKTEATTLAEKVTATETALKAATEKQTEFATQLDALKPIAEAHKAAEQAEKDTLVKALAAHSKALTEDELKAKSLDDLKTLAAFAKVGAPAPNFVGRGVPVARSAQDAKHFEAPDPWAAEIKAAQGK